MTSSAPTRRWDIDLHLGDGELSEGIGRALRDAVTSGALTPGTRLPSSRNLATDLGVARNTVSDAYAQLVAEGWLEARQGSGTWVADRAGNRPVMDPVDTGSRIRMINGFRYSLEPGSPDVSAFPRTAWLKSSRRALLSAPTSALGYVEARGSADLRAVLADYLGRVRGVRCHPEQILICAGFAQAIGLLAQTIAEQGGCLAMEQLSHWAHREIVRRAGADILRLDVDDDGARVGDLTGSAATAVLLTPAHQYPTGAVLSMQRRLDLVDWARSTGGLVIEDDYDGEFQYDRRSSAVQALDPDHVAYCGTTSKSLAPGLRLGWIVLPERWITPTVQAKRYADHQTDIIGQLTLADFIRTGEYDRHLRRSRISYRNRRDQLVEMVTAHAPWVELDGLAGGLHAVLRYRSSPDLPDEDDLAVACAQHDLAPPPALSEFGRVEPGYTAVVVGYATPPAHAYRGAITALCRSLQPRRSPAVPGRTG